MFLSIELQSSLSRQCYFSVSRKGGIVRKAELMDTKMRGYFNLKTRIFTGDHALRTEPPFEPVLHGSVYARGAIHAKQRTAYFIRYTTKGLRTALHIGCEKDSKVQEFIEGRGAITVIVVMVRYGCNTGDQWVLCDIVRFLAKHVQFISQICNYSLNRRSLV